jgi:hypothetical protein
LRENDARAFPEIYDLKNEDYEFSRAVSSFFQGDVWVGWIKWFLESALCVETQNQPKNILDLGSDNGVITCLLAAFFPNAKVIGIDRSQEGVNISELIAERLGLDNVEFVHSDAGKYLKDQKGMTFDLVNALTFFKEATLIEPNKDWAFTLKQKQVKEPVLDLGSIELINSAIKSLSKEGKLFSTERIGGVDDCRAFMDHYHAAGAKAVTTDGICFENTTGTLDTLPIVVFEKTDEKEKRISFVEAHSLITKVYRNNPEFHCSPIPQDGYSAWILFESLKGKELLEGALLVYDNASGLMTAEIWKTEFCIIWFSRTVLGHGEIIMFSGSNKDEASSRFREVVEKHEKMKAGEVHLYNSVMDLNAKLDSLGHDFLTS